MADSRWTFRLRARVCGLGSMFTSPTGRLRPIWSFLLSAGLSAAAFLACSYIAGAIFGDHVLRFEALFRPLLAASLFGIYWWLLTVGDQMEERRVALLGFPHVRGWIRQLGFGVLLGLALTVLALLLSTIRADFNIDINITNRTLERGGVALIVLIFGALAEELMFRGYPFQRLEEAIGPVGAIGVFSLLFGAVHLTNRGATVLGIVNTVLIGVVLAIAYLRTRALWLPLGIHFGWNVTLGLLLGLPVSGLRLFNVMVRSSETGPHWLTGGSYGLEASAPGVVAVLAGLLAVCALPFRRIGEPLPSPAAEPEHVEPEHLDSVAGIQPSEDN